MTITPDDLLKAVDEMRDNLAAHGFSGPWSLIINPRTRAELGEIPVSALPADVTLAEDPLAPCDVVTMVDEDEYEELSDEGARWLADNTK